MSVSEIRRNRRRAEWVLVPLFFVEVKRERERDVETNNQVSLWDR